MCFLYHSCLREACNTLLWFILLLKLFVLAPSRVAERVLNGPEAFWFCMLLFPVTFKTQIFVYRYSSNVSQNIMIIEKLYVWHNNETTETTMCVLWQSLGMVPTPVQRITISITMHNTYMYKGLYSEVRKQRKTKKSGFAELRSLGVSQFRRRPGLSQWFHGERGFVSTRGCLTEPARQITYGTVCV